MEPLYSKNAFTFQNEYLEYFDWKAKYTFYYKNPYCTICQKLHNKDEPVKMYPNMNQWYNYDFEGNKQCSDGSERKYYKSFMWNHSINFSSARLYRPACLAILSINLINIFTGSQSWNRRHHRQTIHPTEKLNSMNLFRILCVVTWAWLFLTSMVMEAVRGQNKF